jgi:4-diphosphocytidyl-2-C-methyl-D-erythritol kinase
MNSYTLIAPAKINLYLKIIGDRPDGFHELVMIMQAIDLADKIRLNANGIDDFRLFCSHPEVPVDRTNLADKAARLMAQTFPKAFANYGGIDITIEKNIPIAAGLAGGSSNAAAVLVGINLMWQLGLTRVQIQELAAQLGSDIPFSVSGGTAIATGRGEILDALPNLDRLWLVLAKYDNLSVSTAWAYNTYRQQFGHTYIPDAVGFPAANSLNYAGKLIEAIVAKNSTKMAQLMRNDLEKVVLPEYPAVEKLRSTLAAAGVLGTMMSGSGPTVFALCASEAAAREVKEKVAKELNDRHLDLWVTSSCSHGIELDSLFC